MKTTAQADLLRALPSIDELLRSADLQEIIAREGREPVALAAREVIAKLRSEIKAERLGEHELQLALAG
ncbi:MAG TPA: hypothetical protein VE998_12505, partial [Terriglobales bacterium]|nr:hypothetical protein [Terriglobales bacterium]